MEQVSLTALRANLYQLVDQVIASGEPIIIKRNNDELAIALRSQIKQKKKKKRATNDLSLLKERDKKDFPKLSRLTAHPGTIIGDIDEPSWDDN